MFHGSETQLMLPEAAEAARCMGLENLYLNFACPR